MTQNFKKRAAFIKHFQLAATMFRQIIVELKVAKILSQKYTTNDPTVRLKDWQ